MNRKLLLVPAVLLALGLSAGVSYASIPAPDGTINGCYSNDTHPHALYIRDSANACPSGDTSLNFNQAGPSGPEGPAGPTGPAGAKVVGAPTGGVGTVEPGTTETINDTCPAAVGSPVAAVGGEYVLTNADNTYLTPSQVGTVLVTGAGTSSEDTYSVTVVVSATATQAITVVADAICLTN